MTSKISTVADIRTVLEKAYPPRLAEKWDAVGLTCGDPAAEVRKVVFALDCNEAVVNKAIESGADMLVTHHPLLLRGVHSVAVDTPKGKIIHRLISNKIALFSAHTNADSARPGVNDKLAELVGIKPGRPIIPKDPKAIDKWGIQVPEESLEEVKAALFSAGAATIGEYSESCFQWEGRSQFLPGQGASPHAGRVGESYVTSEVRVEFVAPSSKRMRLINALRAAHPYEEPAFDVIEMAPTNDLDSACGLGRIGELDTPMTLRDFTQQVANALPETVWGVRAAGDPDRMVKKVAVSSGAGDSFLNDVKALGVDVYVTSDLRHHPVDEHLLAEGPAVIDTAHWASEFPWTKQASELVAAGTNVECEIISVRTDPWTISAHAVTAHSDKN